MVIPWIEPALLSAQDHDLKAYPEMRGQSELTIVAVCTFAYTSGYKLDC